MVDFSEAVVLEFGCVRVRGDGVQDGVAALVPGEVQKGGVAPDAGVGAVGGEGIVCVCDPIDGPAMGLEGVWSCRSGPGRRSLIMLNGIPSQRSDAEPCCLDDPSIDCCLQQGRCWTTRLAVDPNITQHKHWG